MGENEEARRAQKRAALMGHPQSGVDQTQQLQQRQQQEQARMGAVPVRAVVREAAAPSGAGPVARVTDSERLASAAVGAPAAALVADVRRFHPEALPTLKEMELYRMFGPERVTT
jgi:hypothetical protein